MNSKRAESGNVSFPSGKGRLERCARLRLAYDKERIRLAAVRTFMKVLPVAAKSPLSQGSAGTWLEVLDKEGRVLWSKNLGPVLRFDLEVHNGTKTNSFTRVPNPEAAGFFDVIVPMLPGAAGVRLFTPPLRPDAGQVASSEVRLQLALDAEKEIWREMK